MGADTRILAVPDGPLTDDEILDIQYRLCGAVGPREFWWPESRAVVACYDDQLRFVLKLPERYYGTVLRVDLSERYYGIGYERGSLPTISAVCDWIDANRMMAFYGADHHESLCPWSDQREELWRHWFQHGSEPYRVGRDADPAKMCCGHGMSKNGSDHWFCYGCGSTVDRRSDGRIVRKGPGVCLEEVTHERD